MDARRVLVSLAAALVSFLVVAIAVTEVLAERIWPSLLVGIPAGFVAGGVAFVLAWYPSGGIRSPTGRSRRDWLASTALTPARTTRR